jgi:integrase
MTTSPNVAEICGLRWRRVNLTDDFQMCDGQAIPPRSMWIVENWHKGKSGTVKTAKRRRILPLPDKAVEMMREWRKTSSYTQPDDYVFAGRTGKPIDAHNTSNRIFKPLSKELGVKVGWHGFRHSCASWAEQVGMRTSSVVVAGAFLLEIFLTATRIGMSKRCGVGGENCGRIGMTKNERAWQWEG